jgi:hypothetical protein
MPLLALELTTFTKRIRPPLWISEGAQAHAGGSVPHSPTNPIQFSAIAIAIFVLGQFNNILQGIEKCRNMVHQQRWFYMQRHLVVLQALQGKPVVQPGNRHDSFGTLYNLDMEHVLK